MIRNKVFYSLSANNQDLITKPNIVQGNLPETFQTENKKQPFFMPVFSLPANNIGLMALDNQIQGNPSESMPINFWQKKVSYELVTSNEHIVHPEATLVFR